jgi:hypothetical protein
MMTGDGCLMSKQFCRNVLPWIYVNTTYKIEPLLLRVAMEDVAIMILFF